MSNVLLYLVTVLIWGTTWYAIKLQLGVVPESWSVAWRFYIAAAVMALWLAAHGRLKNYPRGVDLAYVVAQGALLFSLNYWLFYIASNHLTTGLVAVIFSLITLNEHRQSGLVLQAKGGAKGTARQPHGYSRAGSGVLA